MRLFIAGLLLGLAQAACPPPTVSTNNSIVIPAPTLQSKRSFYIAGLFDLHDNEMGMKCGKVNEAAVQSLMAFKFAIETAPSTIQGVNTDFALGGIGFDTCNANSKAIQDIMNFEKCTIGYGDPAILPATTFGYVGPEGDFAEDVAQVLASLHKTQIAFASTDPMYAESKYKPYLMRTIPTDHRQLEAIFALLMKMQYKTVQFVHSESHRGRKAREEFEKMAVKAGICVEQFVDVPENTMKPTEYDEAVNELMERETVRAVVLFFDRPHSDNDKSQGLAFMEAVKRRVANGMFHYIGNDLSHQMALDSVKQSAEGIVHVNPVPVSAVSVFQNWFKSLKPTGQPQPFREYWMDKFNCDLPGSTSHSSVCNVQTQDLSTVDVDEKAGFIIEAVVALINGVKSASAKKCFSKEALCDDFLNAPDKLFLINDGVGSSSNPGFNRNTGDPTRAKYSYMNLQRPTGNVFNHHFVEVGTWQQLDPADPVVNIDASRLRVYDIRGTVINNPQSSCPAGSSCKTCAAPTIPPKEVTTEEEEVIITETTPMPVGAYKMVRRKTWMIPLMVLSGLGILITICFEVHLLSKLIGTKTVKQFRTMWLGQLLLVGVFLSYLLLFAFVPSPTVFTCGLIRFGVGSCYAIMYSVLLVKLMIILSSESIGYLKGIYQVLMFLFAWAVQIVIDAEWLVLVPPNAKWNDEIMDWQCTGDYMSHVQSLVYVMFLILVCTLIAARTHGIITNHREGIFIGLASGFSIPIWIAWTLVGCLNINPNFQEPTLAYGLLINTTLILFTMFLPKVRQLNSMGVEGIYLEDDGNDNEAYGSVVYGPPSYQSRPASVYQVNNGRQSSVYAKDIGNGSGVQMIPREQSVYDSHSQPMYVRSSAGSVRSAPAYAYRGGSHSINSKTLRVTGDLTGRPPFDKKASSEFAFRQRPESIYGKGMKRAGSLTDLGAL